jgi:hypothetical protein
MPIHATTPKQMQASAPARRLANIVLRCNTGFSMEFIEKVHSKLAAINAVRYIILQCNGLGFCC